MYIYIQIFLHMYNIHMYIYIYMYICIYEYICLFIYDIYMCTYICIFTYIYIHMCDTYKYIYIVACTYIHIYIPNYLGGTFQYVSQSRTWYTCLQTEKDREKEWESMCVNENHAEILIWISPKKWWYKLGWRLGEANQFRVPQKHFFGAKWRTTQSAHNSDVLRPNTFLNQKSTLRIGISFASPEIMHRPRSDSHIST